MSTINETCECDIEELHKKSMRMVTATIKALYAHTEHECHLNECQMSLLKDAVKTLKYLHEMNHK